ncbi:hypothetical protein L3Q67_26605 [Saccharothrix sp. AJ9571]|nr:hypothetical protein L3Q67_26605 [Saccharothrix sp. AJ9571]
MRTTMPAADPRAWFPQFYDNSAIRALASARRWTVSGQIGEDPDERKAPIDLRELIDHGRVRGAWSIGPACLTDLDELTCELPSASNAAFYLQAQTDGLVVIDIEPHCPPEATADLLRLPGILYSELSMSGRGIHLVTPVPANLHDFPVAAAKRLLREEHGWYEILLDHWVTFTRFAVPEHVVCQAAAAARPPRVASIEDLYADLAVKARESANVSAAAVSTEGSMPDIPHGTMIVEQTLLSARGRLRAPSDFNDDLSRWEFSALGTLYHWMQTPLRTFSTLGAQYSAGDRAWLLYRAALEVIPVRPKHGQLRNGRPYLLDRAAALVAEREAAEGRARHVVRSLL